MKESTRQEFNALTQRTAMFNGVSSARVKFPMAIKAERNMFGLMGEQTDFLKKIKARLYLP